MNFWISGGVLLDSEKYNEFNNDPVPDLANLALFGLGLAGLGFARRRKAA